jgi:hypothetical protein
VSCLEHPTEEKTGWHWDTNGLMISKEVGITVSEICPPEGTEREAKQSPP